MFWVLLLSHLLGDFLLQSDWMARNRTKSWVLLLHGGIHFALMLLLVGQDRILLWPYLGLLVLIHIGQDSIKIKLNKIFTNQVIPMYILDQIVHILTIAVFTRWCEQAAGPISIPTKPVWALIAIVYLFVSYVWFISERVFNYTNPDYQRNINLTKFPRMLTRSGLTSLVLVAQMWAIPGMAATLYYPYPQSNFRRRAIYTDLSVSLVAGLFLIWAVK